jgi:hypothetical protein
MEAIMRKILGEPHPAEELFHGCGERSIDGSGEMQLTISVQFPPSELNSVCTAGGITTSDSVPNIRPEQNMDFSDYVSVGDTFNVEDPYSQGGSLKAKFTIMEEGK